MADLTQITDHMPSQLPAIDENKVIYLASPYSSPSATVKHARYSIVVDVMTAIYREGYWPFSPIAHAYHAAVREPEIFGKSFEDFQAWDEALVRRCDVLWVACIDGWRTSRGVTSEVDLATRLGKDVRHCFPFIAPDGSMRVYVQDSSDGIDFAIPSH